MLSVIARQQYSHRGLTSHGRDWQIAELLNPMKCV
jgi:hypothetical protein